jgi:hypothetical protein
VGLTPRPLLASLRLAIVAGTVASASVSAHAQDARCPVRSVRCCDVRPVADGIAPTPPTLGVHVWPSSLAQSAEAVQDLVALRPSHLRFGIGPNWRRRPALWAGMSDAEMDEAVASGFAAVPSTARFVAMLTDLRRRLDAKLHLVLWEPPPLPAERVSPFGRKLDARNVDLMARFLVAALKQVAEARLPLDALELSNEPDGGWNIRIAPREYLALLRSVRKEAKRRSVALPPVYGPGTSTIAALQAYLADRDVAEGILDGVDILSVHGWDDRRRADVFGQLDSLLARLGQLGRSKEIAMTEYGIARPVPTDSSPGADMKTRASEGMARSPFFASITTRDLLRLYGRGIGTIIYWEFQDPVWGKASYGLLDTKGTKRPLYHALAAVSAALRQEGAVRFATSVDDRVSLMEGTLGSRLWIANPTREAAPVILDAPRAELLDTNGRDVCRSDDGSAGVTAAAESVVSVPLRKRDILSSPPQ